MRAIIPEIRAIQSEGIMFGGFVHDASIFFQEHRALLQASVFDGGDHGADTIADKIKVYVRATCAARAILHCLGHGG